MLIKLQISVANSSEVLARYDCIRVYRATTGISGTYSELTTATTRLRRGVDWGRVKCGAKYLGISVDEANYWIPPTVDRFETAELCLAELTEAILLVQGTEAAIDGELVETWTERALTAEEKAQIVANLFASIAS